MTDKPWKLVLLLAGIFATGMLSGGFVTARIIRDRMEHRGLPEQWGPARLKMLEKRLELTPEQMDRLRPAIRRDMEDLNRVRQHGFVETRRILQRMEQDITAVLTPEQKVKFEQVSREMRERMQRFMREQRPGGPGGPRERQPRGERPPGNMPPPPPAGEPQPDAPAGKPPGG